MRIRWEGGQRTHQRLRDPGEVNGPRFKTRIVNRTTPESDLIAVRRLSRLHRFYTTSTLIYKRPPQLRPPLEIHITPYLHVSAALTYPWYSAAIRSNKVRTAGADWTTNRAAESFPLHSRAGGQAWMKFTIRLFLSEKSVPE